MAAMSLLMFSLIGTVSAQFSRREAAISAHGAIEHEQRPGLIGREHRNSLQHSLAAVETELQQHASNTTRGFDHGLLFGDRKVVWDQELVTDHQHHQQASILMENSSSSGFEPPHPLLQISEVDEAETLETGNPTYYMLCASFGTGWVLVGALAFLYGHKGPLLLFKAISYIVALTTIKAAVRLVQIKSSFPFPLFLSLMHFITGSLVAFAALAYISRNSGEPILIPSRSVLWTKFMPISFTFVGSVVMGNFSLVYRTTALVELISVSSPIMTVAFLLILRQPFDLKLLGPCCLIVIGVAFAARGEFKGHMSPVMYLGVAELPHFSVAGVALATGVNIPRALKSVLSHLLLKGSGTDRAYSPMEVLAWSCLPSAVLMLLWSLIQEGLEPYTSWYEHGLHSKLTCLLLLSCVNACVLNAAVLYVIKDLGAVGTQIIAQIKWILLVMGGACFFKEQVSRSEVVGLIMVMIGVFLYNEMESRSKEEGKPKVPSPLPAATRSPQAETVR